ncbi:hypothetical protein DXG01_005180 [Tephrocybe rancida]|nr:hypothetical protein DXG01_005180 [Tephrocybe rancida]
MSATLQFDTRTVRPIIPPVADTHAVLKYPHPFVAPPRLPHGFSLLDISKDANIRAQATIKDITKDSADFHITSWSDTSLYAATQSVLALAPANLQFSTGEHIRNLYADPKSPASVRVNFDRPFVTPPKVVVFLNSIDLGKGKNWRLRTTATAIDAKGFTLNIETWSDTVLYAAQVAWVAYPEDETHIFSTSVSTSDVRDWDKPQPQQSKAIKFGAGVEFWKNPDVFVALNEIDIDSKANLRVEAHVDNVSQTGLTWHINSWADTVLYLANISIIAFNA